MPTITTEHVEMALGDLRSFNALEPSGTPQDTAERGAIAALEAILHAAKEA